MKFLNLILSVVFSLAFSLALASGYPSDYPVYSDGPAIGVYNGISIKRSQQGNGGIALDIFYTGNIVYSTSVSAYIRVNYLDGSRDILVPMSRYPGQVGLFARVTNGCLVGMLGGCKIMGTDAMKHLLYWAVRPNHSGLNALSLELAFVDSYGRWDSNLNRNYHFQFIEKLR